jgi:hypothetical protein
MSKPIEETLRCKLFEGISKRIWHRVIRKHSLGLNDKEEAITNDILADILEYHQTSPLNFDVFARDGYLEKKYGRDIDIFIEVAPNKYRWFAFQAKLLKIGNEYTGLNHTSPSKKNAGKQWLKLRRLEVASKGGCKANYLFYNGKADFSITRQSNCNPLVNYTEEQYGCSIIDIETIKRIATTKGPGKKRRWIIPNPTFEDFHPQHARPWRELVCCWLENNPKEVTMYSYEDIKNSVKNYDRLVFKGEPKTNNNDDNMPTKDNDSKSGGQDIFSDNPIIQASLEANWKPGIRLVISITDLSKN